MANKTWHGVRWFFRIIGVAAATEYFTYGAVSYPVAVQVAVDVRSPEGTPAPSAAVSLKWSQSRSSSESAATELANAVTSTLGKAELRAELPGTVNKGWIRRAIQWLGEDTPRRRADVQEVLRQAIVSAERDGAGMVAGHVLLSEAEVIDPTYGPGTLFRAPRPVAMRATVVLLPKPTTAPK